MTNTSFGNTVVDAQAGRIKVAASLPTAPVDYYGTRVGHDEWRGGETIYNSSDSRIYIQTATSGTTATWKRLLTQFATSTTSTSTTTSTTTSSSSTSSSSSSTSSSTSTSTSTSSSSSTTSSTSSSTTTMA